MAEEKRAKIILDVPAKQGQKNQRISYKKVARNVEEIDSLPTDQLTNTIKWLMTKTKSKAGMLKSWKKFWGNFWI